MRWRSRGGGEYFARCHWHYFASSPNSSRCYLLGTDDRESDEYFSAVLEVDFESMGVYDEPAGELGSDLSGVFDKADAGSDFEIVSATTGAPSIKCHKCILEARWKHFGNLMGSGCKESLTPATLHLPDEYATLRALLFYLYTDTLPTSHPLDVVCSLLPLANMYCLPRLQRLCATALDKAIDVESVARIFEVAGRAGEQGLKEKALGLMWGRYGEVIATEGFRNLPKEVMLEFLDSTPKESVVLVQPRRWIRGRGLLSDGRGREPHARGRRVTAVTAESEGEGGSDVGGSEGEEGEGDEMDD
ncbi:hypothetical protein HDU93_005082 [Gonapodya sp. JEL0774]|nr:hypothetical protein HDU93_005082 [Gonapodya sp. JEL0774]